MRILQGILGPNFTSVCCASSHARYDAAGHCSCTKVSGRGVNGLNGWMPGAEFVFGIIKDLASSLDVLKGWVGVAGHDWGVVEKVEETTSLFCEDDLLFGTLNCRGKVDVVGFFEFLAGLKE